MSEAPKTIFLINPELDQYGWDSKYVNFQDRPITGLLSVEYIRKDVYDELDVTSARFKLAADNSQNKLGTRIKELEDTVRFYADGRNVDTQLDIDMTGCTSVKVRERRGISIEPFGTTARNELEKESEG